MNRKITLILPLFVLGFLFSAKAQCPANIDFESGLTPGWLYYVGTVNTGPVFTWGAVGAPVAGYHALTTMPGTDPYGGFPVVSPGGGLHSCKILHDVTGQPASRIRYNIHVPSGPGIYSLIYRYAVVLNDPGTSHTPPQKPQMIINAVDSTTGNPIACTNYVYIAGGSVPGFLLSSLTAPADGTPVNYKPWTLGNMKFPGENGKTVTLDVIANGCSLGGHFGYGYFDMSCGFYANSLITCAFGNTTLSGPDGFSGYAWYDSSTFGTYLGGSQSIVISSPTVTTTYAVILTPYSGSYGCTDTLYTVVRPTSLHMVPSNDTSICAGSSITLHAGATSVDTPIHYLWGPSTGLSCVTCAAPVATPSVSTNYYVTATDSAGCQLTDTIHVTVFPIPGGISGPTSVCLGQQVTLGDSPAGGLWSSSLPSTASIGSVTGIVTGNAVGTTAIITYTLGGSCRATRGITVNPLPSIITGNAAMCIGTSTVLTDSIPGGTWSGGGIVSVTTAGSATGIVTGLSAGVTLVTYTLSSTGCFRTRSVTVNPTPNSISSAATVCVGATIVVSDPFSPGGTWSCSPLADGSITSITGVFTGIAAGAVTITYSLPTTCYTTTTVNVLPIPGAISGPNHVCIGDTILLTDTSPTGTWSTTSPDVFIPDPTVGKIVGEPITGSGVAIISYIVGGSSCPALYSVTVNPLASPIGGIPSVCIGQTTALTDADPPPGVWVSSNPAVSAIGSSSGIVSGNTLGNDTVTYTNSLGCKTTIGVTVDPLPSAITGPTSLCVGTFINLSDPTPGGTFSTTVLGAHASVTPGGLVTGISVGTQVITYSISPIGCYVTYTVTVNTTPTPITGTLSVCQTATTILNDLTAGGIWSISPSTTASIIGVATTATVTGVLTGTATVTYQLGVGCSTTAIVTVNPTPGAILPSGPNVCVGSSTLILTDPTSPGGAYVAAPTPGNATVTSSGTVTGVSAGLQVISYTAPTGCVRTTTVNVNPLPLPIGGPTAVCVNSTIPLTDGSLGGTWTSLNLPIATITTPGGILTGVAPGTATIKYQLPTTCATATVVTVNAIPPLFTTTGGGSMCAGTAGVNIGLSGSTVGVNYRVSIGGVPTGPTVAGTGSPIVFGPETVAGTYTIVGSYPATGCSRTMTGSVTVTVNAVPVITGPTALCVGTTITEVSSIVGSTWSSSAPLNASIGATTGIVTGLITGTSTVITCTSPVGGCSSTTTVNVSPSPGPPTGVSTVCVADSILLSDIVPGGTWTSSAPLIASVGSLSGYVTGVSTVPTNTVTITYSLGTGCQQTKVISVNPQPSAITGGLVICQGATTLLHDGSPLGTWSVAPSSVSLASVSTTGLVTGTITGTTTPAVATIFYSLTATGCHSWALVTVNPLPLPIGGSLQVCQGSTTTLTDGTGFGSWSITSPGYASIVAGTGLVTGLAAGSPSTVTYTAGGCYTTAVLTVNPLPGAITGTAHVCQGTTTTLNATPAGGTWSTTTPALLSLLGVSGTVIITGGPGTGPGSVTYTLSTGCARTIVVTVNATPAPIIGPASVCVGHTAVMSDPTPGGSWSSSVPTTAAIGAGTGLITTSAAGSVIISYTVGTCAATTIFDVLPPPAPIGGPLHVCVGGTTTLTDATPGGTWQLGSPALASITPGGVVTGISAGTVIVSYGSFGAGGCFVPAPVIVNPIANVQGDSQVCLGQQLYLVDTILGGNWTSSAPTIAPVGFSSGIVTGAVAGNATITYTIALTGCSRSQNVTVNPLPAPISGPPAVCVGQSITLADATLGGTWSATNGLATIDGSAGIVTGVSSGNDTMVYTLSSTTGCVTTYPIVINPLPAPIVGPDNLCLGQTATYADGGLGSWSSSVPGTVTINPVSGFAIAFALGSVDITYQLVVTGCSISKTVNVLNPPTGIYSFGPPVVCSGSSFALFDSSGSGTWSSSNPGVAYVGPTTGVVTGISGGNATITYSTGVGCTAVMPVTINQNPTYPSSGSTDICVGQSTTFTSIPLGGTWTSSATAYGTVTSATGVVTGISAGTTIIGYSITYPSPGTACSTSIPVNVNATPAPITGIPTVCVGLTSTLADADLGGVWASSAPSFGSIDAFGVVSGIAPGVTTITYTMPLTTCPAIMVVTVNPQPSTISGVATVCQFQNTALSDLYPGGVWSSAPSSIASVNSFGSVTGLLPGTADITYTMGAACSQTLTVTVIPVPAAINGPDSVCQGQFLFFTDPTSFGSWSSTVPAVGNISATTGVMAGVAAGTTTISYTVNGCAATQLVSVNVQPAPITGNPIVCLGGTSALHDAIPGGTWSSLFPPIATISTSGVVFGVAVGSSVITYEISPGGCNSTLSVNVVPLPVKFNMTGGGSYCAGGTGVPVGLDGSTLGVNYMLYVGSTATGSVAGSGSAITFGPQTVAGNYTVIATTTATGCTQLMNGVSVVSVTPTVTPHVTITPSPNDTVCTGTSVTFTPVPVNGGTVPLYQWSVNGTSVSTGINYTFIPANGDSVSVVMTSTTVCPLPATANGHVKMTVQPFGYPALNITAHPGETVCQGSLVTVTTAPVDGGPSPLFTWMKNGVISGTASTYAFVPLNHDIVYCIMQSDYPCRLSTMDTSNNLVMVIDTPVQPLVTIHVSPNTIISAGTTVTLNATVVNGGTSPTYQWYENSMPITGATNATYVTDTFKTPEYDSISCMVTSNGLCPVTGHKWVFIQVAPVSVGHVANTASDINVVPNPNKGDFMIKGTLGSANDEEVSFEITDIIGQVVYKDKVTAKNGKLNEHVVLGNTLANGMYVLSVHTSEENKVFHMVIEQ